MGVVFRIRRCVIIESPYQNVILSIAKDLDTFTLCFQIFGQSPQQLVFTMFRMTRHYDNKFSF